MGACDPILGTTTEVLLVYEVVQWVGGGPLKILQSPASVTVNVRSPSGVVSHPVATEQTEGVFVFEVPVDETGRWRWSAISTGDPTATKNGSFQVQPLTVP